MKKIIKQPFFYVATASFILLLLMICNYIFGWTTPTQTPPNANLSAPLNVSATNQSKIGALTIGTSTPPVYTLDLYGQLKSYVAQGTAPFIVTSTTTVTNLNADLLDGYHAADIMAAASCTVPVEATTYFESGGNPRYCKKRVVNSTGLTTIININQYSQCDANSYCNNGVCTPYTGTWLYCDEDNDGHYSATASTQCPSGSQSTTKGDDCDDSCATCYPGSTSFTANPDNKDQDCDGEIDELQTDYVCLGCKYLYYSSCEVMCASIETYTYPGGHCTGVAGTGGCQESAKSYSTDPHCATNNGSIYCTTTGSAYAFCYCKGQGYH